MYGVTLYNESLRVSGAPTMLLFVVPLGGEGRTKGSEEDLKNFGGESLLINAGHYDQVTINRCVLQPLLYIFRLFTQDNSYK